MAPTTQDPLTGRSPAQAALDWLRARWQQSQGQVPGGPPRIGNVSVPGPGQGPLPGAPLPGAPTAAPAVAVAGPVAATPTATPGREQPPDEKPFAAPKDEIERLFNRLWEIEWAQHTAEQEATDPAKLPSEQQSAATRATALGNQWATINGQINTERLRVQTDTEQRAAKPARGTKLPDARKTYTPPGGTPVSAWVPQIADGNGGSTDDPEGTPRLDTSLIGEAVSGGAAGTAEREVDLATKQANLTRLNQQLAAENDPLKKAQLQVAVDQARFTLQQAQAKGPLDLQTAQLTYDTARLAYEQATDPVAKETRAVALEQARVALDAAKQGVARGNAPQVIPTDTTSPVIMTRDPNTGAIKTEPNPAYQGPTFTDATAAYNAQVPRLKASAQQELDRLTELQRAGAISESDASRQFTAWYAGNVEAPLAGYRSAAEEAQRKEQRENEALQRAEDARVQGLNRQREQIGLEAGQKAMLQLAEIAPQIRSPGFLNQFGATVERMSQRAGAQSAEAAAALPSGSTFTRESFDPATIRPHVPSFDAFAADQTRRALAQISPSVAATIGSRPPPPLPTGPNLASLLQGLPYRGPLAGLPSPTSGLLPTPGMEAVDLAGERPGWARTHYGPTGGSFFDWQLPTG